MRIPITLAICAVFALTAHATIIHVPADQPTIQAGVDSALQGDTVLVAPGVYTGVGNREVEFNGVNISVVGSGRPGVTTIDCEGVGGAFYVYSGEDSTSVIEGFTITNATGQGAIFSDSASVAVRNCVVTDNDTWGIKGLSDFAVVVDSCTITNNLGGLLIPNGFVSNCSVIGNSLDGALMLGGERVLITKSLFAHNGEYGAHVAPFCGVSTKITHSTFVGNGYVGLRCYRAEFKSHNTRPLAGPPTSSDSDFVVAYNVAANNRFGIVVNGEGQCISRYLFDVFCNVAYGNSDDDFIVTHVNLIQDMIVGNPLFCDTAGGIYAVTSESPCAPANNNCGVLIGAREVGCACCDYRGNADDDCSFGCVNVADLSFLVDFLFNEGPAPVCEAYGDANNDCTFGCINVSDLSFLVAFLFQDGPAPEGC